MITVYMFITLLHSLQSAGLSYKVQIDMLTIRD